MCNAAATPRDTVLRSAFKPKLEKQRVGLQNARDQLQKAVESSEDPKTLPQKFKEPNHVKFQNLVGVSIWLAAEIGFQNHSRF